MRDLYRSEIVLSLFLSEAGRERYQGLRKWGWKIRLELGAGIFEIGMVNSDNGGRF